MRTAGDIAGRALIRAGVIASGETPTAAELSDAVTTLSDMLDSWSLEALAVFGTTEHVISLTGAQQYTIGPSGDVVATRPIAVRSGFVRRDGEDSELHICSTEYLDELSRKGVQGQGYWLSFEGTMPDAAVRLWPVAEGELHLRVSQPVVQITDINDELDLPPGWFHAMVLNLAVHLCEEYGFALAQGLVETAQTAKANIKRANLKPARSRFDAALL